MTWLKPRKALLLSCIVVFATLFLLHGLIRVSTPFLVYNNLSGTVAYTSAHPQGADGRYNSSRNDSTKLAAVSIANSDALHESQCDVQFRESKILSWMKGVVTQYQPIVPCNCTKLLNDDQIEISSVQQSLKTWHKNAQFMSQLIDWSPTGSNCNEITAEFRNSFYVSQEERDFPLAFSFVSYERTAQVVRLFKAIYRPHNVYCFHPDGKTDAEFVSRFRYLAHCMDNIIMPRELGEVFWGHRSIMDAQMACMAELTQSDVRSKFRWKYAINVCGTELPLRTNREIVRALKPLYQQGLSAIELREMNSEGGRFHHKWVLNKTTRLMKETDIPMGPPPHGITLHKSWNFIAATQSFIDFLLHSRVAQDFYEWIKDGLIPEEHFYASLYYHTHPLTTLTLDQQTHPSVAIYQWMNTKEVRQNPMNFCRGVTVHSVCIQTSGDLARIYEMALTEGQRTYFFFNKYFMDGDHVVMDCMEQRLVKQNQREYLEDCRTSN